MQLEDDGRQVAGVIHFGGGFFTNSMPFAMFSLSPSQQASSNFFSWALTLDKMSIACCAPEGCRFVSSRTR